MKEKWPTVYNKNIKLYYCNDCNHGFLNPYFSKVELNNFYKNEYRKIFVFNIPFKKTVKSVKQMMEEKLGIEYFTVIILQVLVI